MMTNLMEVAQPSRQVAHLRTPPHSMEAEMSLLGGLMMDNSLWDSVVDVVSESDFYRDAHRQVFKAIAMLVVANRAADVVTVFTQLKALRKDEETGGIEFLNSLAQYVPSMRSMRRYADIIREHAMSRNLIKAAGEIEALAFDQSAPIAERMEEATSHLTKLMVGASSDDWESLQDGIVKLCDRFQREADGEPNNTIASGFAALDHYTGGFRPGDLIVLGARPSMGKTALALAIGESVAARFGVGFFSMEMTTAAVNNRLVSMTSRVPLSRVKDSTLLTDEDWPRITDAIESMRNRTIHISDRSGLNIHQVRAKARVLKRSIDLRLLIVDYLGLMVGMDPKMPRVYQLAEITTGLKQLAKELQISVLLLAQVNRDVEKRQDQMPILSDLRDSGSIEQDADIVLFVHREYKAKPQLGQEWANYAQCSVAKQRDGATGLFDLEYVGQYTLFSDWHGAPPKKSAFGAKSDL